jgi:hypothetical protein
LSRGEGFAGDPLVRRRALPAPTDRDAAFLVFLRPQSRRRINRDLGGPDRIAGAGPAHCRSWLPRSPLSLGIGPGPVVSCRTLIFRKRPLLEQPENVPESAAALPQGFRPGVATDSARWGSSPEVRFRARPAARKRWERAASERGETLSASLEERLAGIKAIVDGSRATPNDLSSLPPQQPKKGLRAGHRGRRVPTRCYRSRRFDGRAFQRRT